MYNYTQGTADIGLLLTPYFYKNIDDIYDNPDKIRTLQKEMQESFHLKGYDPSLMQVCNGYSMKYKKYQGQFFPEVEKKTGMSVTDLIMDIYRESGGAGTIYTLFDQKEEDINIQMTHPHALYATDGWYEPSTHQNACTYGAMPKYLHLAREDVYKRQEQYRADVNFAAKGVLLSSLLCIFTIPAFAILLQYS